MKKVFLSSFLAIFLTCLAHSQQPATVCIPIDQAKKVLADAEQYKICQQQVDSIMLVIRDLQTQRDNLRGVVDNDAQKQMLSDQQLSAAQDALKAAQQKADALNRNIIALHKQIRHLRTGKRLLAIGGAVLTVLAAILL